MMLVVLINLFTMMIITVTMIKVTILILSHPSTTNDRPPEFYNWGEVVVVVMTLMIMEF